MQKTYKKSYTSLILNKFLSFIKHNKILIIIAIVLAVVFRCFPDIDLYVSSLFYNIDDGLFEYKESFVSNIFYYGVPYLANIIIVSSLSLLVLKLIFKDKLKFIKLKSTLFIVITLALGPGILVNAILKEHVGRARPLHVTEFGGTQEFTPAFMIVNECETNCSFVSGHASFGFFLMSFAFLITNRRKRLMAWIALLILASFTAFSRVMDGAHFLSDIVFAGIFTYLTIKLVYEFLYIKEDNNDKTELK